MVICLERCADLHMAQLMPLPLTVSCFSRPSPKIQIGFTFLVPAHPGSPGQRAVKPVCVCRVCTSIKFLKHVLGPWHLGSPGLCPPSLTDCASIAAALEMLRCSRLLVSLFFSFDEKYKRPVFLQHKF